ncbi:MAG: hypothetical protein AABW73_02690 [Nanoarchaeota archaeon]
MVIMTMLASFQSCTNSGETDRRVRGIEERLGIIEMDVLGDKETPERFYKVDGRNIYVEIDGEEPKEYFEKHKEEK